MIYLIFAIIFSSSLNVLFKFSEKYKSNRLALTFFNFLGATIFSLIFVLKQISIDTRYISSFLEGFGNDIITPSSLVLLIGLLNGFVYFGSFYVLQISTARNGSAMSATFNKLGVMVPAILSVILFNETPKVMQIFGVIIAILAIIVIYSKKEEGSIITLRIALFATFFLGGFGDFTSKIFQVYGVVQLQSLFIFFTFLFSLIVTGLFMLYKDCSIKRTDVIFGLVAGLPSQFISLFLLRSLSTLPAFVVFPLFSVGVILVVNIINLLFFKEKLTVRQFIAIGFILVAVILLNL